MKTKKIDENIYNERSLFLLNIRELRDLGRKLGVPAPATLKKQDLVDYILKIVYGEVDAPARSSYGRPNVREVDINQYIAKIVKKSDINDELLNASIDDIEGIFKVASPDESKKTNDVQQRIFVEDDGKFYLREFAFVASENDMEVSKAIKQKFSLEEMDVVEVIVSGKSFKIISINGKVVNDTNKLDDDRLGKKQVFHLSTKEEIKEEILNQVRTSEKSGLKTIIFSEDDYEKMAVDFVRADSSQSNGQAYKQFMTFVNLCEKYVYEGENIVVITDQSDFIESVMDSLDKEVSFRTKKHLQSRIKDLLALGNALVVYKLDKDTIYQ